MKRILLPLGMALATMAFSSCSKDDDGPDNHGLNTNTWMLGGKTYTAASVARITGNTALVGRDHPNSTGDVNQCSISFGSFPLTSGSYSIGNVTGPNQIAPAALINEGGVDRVYVATGNDHLTAQVLVTNSKISVLIPEVWAKRLGGTDSLKLAANLIEF